MWPQVLFGVGLIGLSVYLLRSHRLEWAASSTDLGGRAALRFAGARYRRRSLSSGLIGVAGLMLLGGVFVRGQVAMVVYWSFAMAVVVAIIGLATVDLAQARRQLADLRVQHQAERAALEAEVARHLQRRQTNGPQIDRRDAHE